jgi:FlaA1/EpsC-like NDP-sugar epimerase
MFKDKVLFISGATGSFGNAVLRRFIDTDLKEIRISNGAFQQIIDLHPPQHHT